MYFFQKSFAIPSIEISHLKTNSLKLLIVQFGVSIPTCNRISRFAVITMVTSFLISRIGSLQIWFE